MDDADMIDPQVATPATALTTPVEAGSPQWHSLRRTGVGGSDAAAALGLSPWRSRYELYLDKLGELQPTEAGAPMRWGKLLEPTILQAYADATGRRVVQPAATFRSQQFPYMIANLDGLADERVVEVKNVRTAEGWGEPGSDDVPLVYLLQVQHYMVVTGKPVADVAVLIGGSDFRIYEVPADPELQTMLVSGESELWQHVTRREPPLPVSVEDARRRWGAVSVRGGVTAGPQELEAVAVLRESLLRAEELKARIDAAKLTIMLRLGEGGDTLVDASGQPLVTWKLARASERLDAELLAQEHPELFHSYMRPGKPSRRFLMKDSHG